MMPTQGNIIYTDLTDLAQACLNNMNFLRPRPHEDDCKRKR